MSGRKSNRSEWEAVKRSSQLPLHNTRSSPLRPCSPMSFGILYIFKTVLGDKHIPYKDMHVANVNLTDSILGSEASDSKPSLITSES